MLVSQKQVKRMVKALVENRVTELQLRLLVALRNCANNCEDAQGVDALLDSGGLDAMEEVMIEGESASAPVRCCRSSWADQAIVPTALPLPPRLRCRIEIGRAPRTNLPAPLYPLLPPHVSGAVAEIAKTFHTGLTLRHKDRGFIDISEEDEEAVEEEVLSTAVAASASASQTPPAPPVPGAHRTP
jgi:hypothetical protein